MVGDIKDVSANTGQELCGNEGLRGDSSEDTHQAPRLLEIDSLLSELEFLHALEVCGGLRFHVEKIAGSDHPFRNGLFLWRELGRPHPAVLQRFLQSGAHWGKLDWNLLCENRNQLADFVEWTCRAYEAVRSQEREKSELSGSARDRLSCTDESNESVVGGNLGGASDHLAKDSERKDDIPDGNETAIQRSVSTPGRDRALDPSL